MTNYQKSKIYKIVDNTNGNIYIGSTTTKYLSKRLTDHVCRYNKYLNNNLSGYYTSFKILENGNYNIVLIENYPCNNKNELYAREKYYIINNECVNKIYKYPHKKKIYNPQKEKERYQKNKEKIKEYTKQYYQKNKNKFKQKHYCKYCNLKINNNSVYKHYNESNKHIINFIKY